MTDPGYLEMHWRPIVTALYDRGGSMLLVELSADGSRYVPLRRLTRDEALTRPLTNGRQAIRDVEK